jgi:hypothetical protein
MRERTVCERNGDKARFGRERRRISAAETHSRTQIKALKARVRQLLGLEEDEPDI